MKPEQAEILWKELFEILKILTDQKEIEAAKLEEIRQMIKSFEENLVAMKMTALPTDLSPVVQTINNGIEELKKIVLAQPKSVVREFHFHLFPKINIKEYYQTYGKLLLFITIFALALAFINFSDKWIEGYNQRQKELQQVQLKEKNKLSPLEDDQHILKQKPNKKNEFHSRNNTNKKLLTDSLTHIPQKQVAKNIDTTRK
ncbi:MAG TPA: hypothetical protein VHZ50_11075 [Puia sp.]|nr:hypothetical protein [Puia sp.]